jgi:argininosuccinate lyase
VREGEQLGVELTALPFSSFQRAHSAFAEDVYDALNASSSVAHREAEGGTGPIAVRAQIDAARTALLPPPTPRSSNAAI